MFATGVTMDLAEWIIDVLSIFYLAAACWTDARRKDIKYHYLKLEFIIAVEYILDLAKAWRITMQVYLDKFFPVTRFEVYILKGKRSHLKLNTAIARGFLAVFPSGTVIL